jgi:TPR repeat protein
MTQPLRLLIGAIIITIFAAPIQAESFKQASLNNLDSIHDAEYKLELKTIEPLATSGSAAAQNRLGRMYEFGQGHDINPNAAFAWYQKTAAKNHMEGKMNLARSYNFGLGAEQDFIKAEALYKQYANTFSVVL